MPKNNVAYFWHIYHTKAYYKLKFEIPIVIEKYIYKMHVRVYMTVLFTCQATATVRDYNIYLTYWIVMEIDSFLSENDSSGIDVQIQV